MAENQQAHDTALATVVVGDFTFSKRSDGWWASSEQHAPPSRLGEDPKLEALISLAEEYLETRDRLDAVLAAERFPTSEQVQACLRRINRRDAEIIDKAFDQGATLLVAAKWDLRKCDRLLKESEERAAQLEAKLGAVISADFIERKVAWSRETFGPGARTAGVCTHIKKELQEVERAPNDVTEWADIILLAMDGALRAGATGADLIRAVVEKDSANRERTWPDWRTLPADAPIEHTRDEAAPLANGGGEVARG